MKGAGKDMCTNYTGYHDNLSAKFKEILNYSNVIERIMQDDKITTFVNMLHWNLQESEVNSIIRRKIDLIDASDYDMLLLAGQKHTWSNTVKFIAAAGYPKNKKALPSLVLLLQDLNWPGANDGMRVLKAAHMKDSTVSIPILEAAIESAFIDNDTIWLAWIKHFLKYAQIDRSCFINHDIYDLLKHAEW